MNDMFNWFIQLFQNLISFLFSVPIIGNVRLGGILIGFALLNLIISAFVIRSKLN